MLSRIHVFIDDDAVTIWSWARVRHALNWHSEEAYRDVLSGHKVVCDAAGHPVDLDGALEDGVRLHLEDPERLHLDGTGSPHAREPRYPHPKDPQ